MVSGRAFQFRLVGPSRFDQVRLGPQQFEHCGGQLRIDFRRPGELLVRVSLPRTALRVNEIVVHNQNIAVAVATAATACWIVTMVEGGPVRPAPMEAAVPAATAGHGRGMVVPLQMVALPSGRGGGGGGAVVSDGGGGTRHALPHVTLLQEQQVVQHADASAPAEPVACVAEVAVGGGGGGLMFAMVDAVPAAMAASRARRSGGPRRGGGGGASRRLRQPLPGRRRGGMTAPPDKTQDVGVELDGDHPLAPAEQGRGVGPQQGLHPVVPGPVAGPSRQHQWEAAGSAVGGLGGLRVLLQEELDDPVEGGAIVAAVSATASPSGRCGAK